MREVVVNVYIAVSDTEMLLVPISTAMVNTRLDRRRDVESITL